MPTFKEFLDFLELKCHALESISNKDSKLQGSNNKRFANAALNSWPCPICQGDHNIVSCTTFNSHPVKDRIKIARKKSLCLNCFKDNHSTGNCRASTRCKTCHRILHLKVENEETASSSKTDTSSKVVSEAQKRQSNSDETSSQDSDRTSLHVKMHGNVILPTAIVKLEDCDGNLVKCRALIDTGSQSHFISASMA